MELLLSSFQRSSALRKINPHSIAVAFVGYGWESLLDVDSLREIIVSTSLGSNPYAIEKLIEILGAENVYFLDGLHSKLYIGNDSVMIGSANLSSNGFGLCSNNHEICVLLDDVSSVRQAQEQFDKYRESAISKYSTVAKRKVKLMQMFSDWRDSEALRTDVYSDGVGVSIEPRDFLGTLDRIHVVPCCGVPSEVNEITANQLRSDPDFSDVDTADQLKERFSCFVQMHASDDVKVGDWLLMWPVTNSGLPHATKNIYWMYVSHVIDDFFVDENYEKLVGCLEGIDMPPPFRITKKFQSEFKRLISLNKYRKMRYEDDVWLLNDCADQTSEFLSELKGAL